jgi:hypothetical protein
MNATQDNLVDTLVPSQIDTTPVKETLTYSDEEEIMEILE